MVEVKRVTTPLHLPSLRMPVLVLNWCYLLQYLSAAAAVFLMKNQLLFSNRVEVSGITNFELDKHENARLVTLPTSGFTMLHTKSIWLKSPEMSIECDLCWCLRSAYTTIA